MKNRFIEKVLSIAMVLCGIAGLVLQTGALSGGEVHLRTLTLFYSISTMLVIGYELAEFYYVRHHKKGVFFALWKYASFICFTYSFLIHLLFLRPYDHNLTGTLQTGYYLLHAALPALVYLDWMIGEKGHFYSRFLVVTSFFPVLYLILAAALSGTPYHIGMEGYACAYPFFDTKVLGWGIVIGTTVMLILGFIIYAELMTYIDDLLDQREER